VTLVFQKCVDLPKCEVFVFSQELSLDLEIWGHLLARPKILLLSTESRTFLFDTEESTISGKGGGHAIGVVSPPQHGQSTSGLGFTEMCRFTQM